MIKSQIFRYLNYFLFVFMLFSCSNTENKIILNQTTSFKLPINSKTSIIIQSDVDYYRVLTNQKLSNQLILYKLIYGKNYQLYIGVAIDVTVDKIHKQLISNSMLKLIKEKSTSSDSAALILQIDSVQFCLHYIKQLNEGDKYLFSFISKDTTFLEGIYNSSLMEKSFVYE